jgi:hypothetical protein
VRAFYQRDGRNVNSKSGIDQAISIPKFTPPVVILPNSPDPYRYQGGEERIISEIMIYLRAKECYAIRTHDHGELHYNQLRKGIPDILVCYRGQFVAFEVKTWRGEAQPHQKEELAEIRSSGGAAHVVRSVADVRTILHSLD